MPEIVQELVEALATHEEITVALLFGSAARGEMSELSDVDVGVVLGNGRDNLLRYRARLAEELSQRMGGVRVQVVLLDEAAPARAGASRAGGSRAVVPG